MSSEKEATLQAVLNEIEVLVQTGQAGPASFILGEVLARGAITQEEYDDIVSEYKQDDYVDLSDNGRGLL